MVAQCQVCCDSAGQSPRADCAGPAGIQHFKRVHVGSMSCLILWLRIWYGSLRLWHSTIPCGLFVSPQDIRCYPMHAAIFGAQKCVSPCSFWVYPNSRVPWHSSFSNLLRKEMVVVKQLKSWPWRRFMNHKEKLRALDLSHFLADI